MLRKLGIETPLQFAVAFCVMSLVIITTIGSGGPPLVFFLYRTLLVVITFLCVFGCRHAGTRISPWLLALLLTTIGLMLISVVRIEGSHFEGLYLWYRESFFICMFLALAHYSRSQSAAWKGMLLGTVIVTCIFYLVRDLIANQRPLLGFSRNNGDYFATYLLIGVAASVAVALFGIGKNLRIAAALSAILLIFGVAQTGSRGATLAVLLMAGIAAVRASDRIPRHVRLFAALVGLVIVFVFSPRLVAKFLSHGQADPYNYARPQIWLSSLRIIGQNPILGTGFGQFFSVSKRFAFPTDGQVARYLVRISMAHSEYLQHIAELGIPTATLLLSILACVVYLTWKRAQLVWPEFRCFHEAALLTAAGVGTHALVDNCWTIPVTAAGLVVLSSADALPLREKERPLPWNKPALVLAAAVAGAVYIHAIVIPGLGLYYNELGHRAYEKFDFASAERYHFKAVSIVPNNPLFLDNLGMVYLDQAAQTRDGRQLDQARFYFTKAIAGSSRSLDPHMHLEAALIQTLTGHPENDKETYHRIIENDLELLQIDPFIPFSRKNLANAFYQLGDRDRAFRELKKAIEYEPNYVPGYLQFAAWYMDAGDTASSERYTAEAIGIINKYRNIEPRGPYETLLLARPAPDARRTSQAQ